MTKDLAAESTPALTGLAFLARRGPPARPEPGSSSALAQRPDGELAVRGEASGARAFGVGLLLSTQNPVDLDYKAMSNAGTWCIGRLQTERDKARIMDALQTAGGDRDHVP